MCGYWLRHEGNKALLMVIVWMLLGVGIGEFIWWYVQGSGYVGMIDWGG